MVTQIYQSKPGASMDEWIEGVNNFDENFRSFMLAGHLDHEFYDIDVVMQVYHLTVMDVLKQLNFNAIKQ